LKEGFTQIKKESLTDRIHDSILEMIIKNPSDEEQVLNEKRLMELFGVSKAPVREALIKLCSEGVLRNVPRFGYMVIRMNEQDALRMRVLLETEALETAFPNLEERELAEIRDHVSKAAAKQNVDVWEVWEDNKQFHLLLASFSGNRILMKLLQECMEMLTRSYAQKMWDKRNSMADSVDEAQHYGIYQKLCDKDLEGAIALLECDINSY
jgi:DNA-binding GntR family transcriptional regulator